jgi:hypothetical protein
MWMHDAWKRVREFLDRPRIGDALKWEVEFDSQEIRVRGKGAPQPIRWDDVKRIAYETTNWGPWWDYFISFQLRSTSMWIALEFGCKGVLELSNHVRAMPGTLSGPQSCLANCTECKSVVVWPAEDAGKTIDECSDGGVG